MVYADSEDVHPCKGSVNQNLFCQMLNSGEEICELCGEDNRELVSNTSTMTRSINCFAGLKETAVPVRCGNETVAFLKTGHVFNEEPSEEQFEKTAEALRKLGYSKKRIGALRKAYEETLVVNPRAYHGMVTVLTAFAMQLGELANRIIVNESQEEPAMVKKAKRFILENLDEPISLDLVAKEVNISSFYFCKIFKQATGLTFTEHVNRQRIEWAKRKLLNREVRVTEVAFDVGYQSLSQFNRSFSKIVGESPTGYRQRIAKEPEVLVA
jgi:AraC-like DNA-binding protein